MSAGINIEFTEAGDFTACRAAEQWCKDNGVSYGPLDRFDSRGLLYGNYAIAKWHNLTQRERKACHGVMTGDMRKGPVRIAIRQRAQCA